MGKINICWHNNLLRFNFFASTHVENQKVTCGFVFSQSTLIWISLGFSFLYGINYSKKRIFLPGCPATDSFFHWSTTFRSCSRPPRIQTWRHVGRSRFKAGSEDLRSSRVALRTLFIFAKCCRTWHEPPWKKKKRIHATLESWKTSPWKKINFYLKKEYVSRIVLLRCVFEFVAILNFNWRTLPKSKKWFD